MKKSILMAAMICAAGMLSAQNTPPATYQKGSQQSDEAKQVQATEPQQTTTPPGAVTKRFNSDYPNMPVTWTMSGNQYRAEYTDPSSKLGRAVVYDETGNPVRMEQEIGRGLYPATITEYYVKSYPNEKFRVWTTDNTSRKGNFFVIRQNEVIWFDEKGNYSSKGAMMQDRSDK